MRPALQYIGVAALAAVLTIWFTAASPSHVLGGSTFAVRVFSEEECTLTRVSLFSSTHDVTFSGPQLALDELDPSYAPGLIVPSFEADEYRITLEFEGCDTAYGPPQLIEPGQVFYIGVGDDGAVVWNRRA